VRKIDAFWDTSAIVPLCVAQAGSAFSRQAWKNRSIAVWWGTPVEASSAFARLARSGELDRQKLRMAMTRLSALRQMWLEVLPSEGLRELAEDLVLRYPLHAADSLQLAAALIWSHRHPRKRAFVCLDNKLAGAAEKEGFAVHTRGERPG